MESCTSPRKYEWRNSLGLRVAPAVRPYFEETTMNGGSVSDQALLILAFLGSIRPFNSMAAANIIATNATMKSDRRIEIRNLAIFE